MNTGQYKALSDSIAEFNSILLNNQAHAERMKAEDSQRKMQQMQAEQNAWLNAERVAKAKDNMAVADWSMSSNEGLNRALHTTDETGSTLGDGTARRITGDPGSTMFRDDNGALKIKRSDGSIHQMRKGEMSEFNKKIMGDVLLSVNPDTVINHELNHMGESIWDEQENIQSEISALRANQNPVTAQADRAKIKIKENQLAALQSKLATRREEINTPESVLERQKEYKNMLETSILSGNLSDEQRGIAAKRIAEADKTISEVEPKTKVDFLNVDTGVVKTKKRKSADKWMQQLANKEGDATSWIPLNQPYIAWNQDGKYVRIEAGNPEGVMSARAQGYVHTTDPKEKGNVTLHKGDQNITIDASEKDTIKKYKSEGWVPGHLTGGTQSTKERFADDMAVAEYVNNKLGLLSQSDKTAIYKEYKRRMAAGENLNRASVFSGILDEYNSGAYKNWNKEGNTQSSGNNKTEPAVPNDKADFKTGTWLDKLLNGNNFSRPESSKKKPPASTDDKLKNSNLPISKNEDRLGLFS